MTQPDPPKSRSLLGITDLTLAAPIRRSLIGAVDSRSHETRLRLLLATLSAVRTSSKEARPVTLLDDAVDRIQSIQSFRLAIVGEPSKRQLVLAVAFDGGWEPYMRRIWRDLGPLLDVIFCNCEDYPIAKACSYADYIAWVRKAQVHTGFFYTGSTLTVADLHHLRKAPPMPAPPVPTALLLDEALPGLAALYRLGDMYPPRSVAPDSDDGDILWRAARHLFEDRLTELCAVNPAGLGRTRTERAALQWFQTTPAPRVPPLPQPPSPPPPPPPPAAGYAADKVQGGIVESYGHLTHGCLLLVRLKGAGAARALVDWALREVTTGARQKTFAGPYVNLAFTLQGLQVAGVPQGTIEQMPAEFREGMEARASILGDHDANHPSRWHRPVCNWPSVGVPPQTLELTSVHVLVQFQACDFTTALQARQLNDPQHPLSQAVADFEKALSAHGVTILGVQETQRYVTQAQPAPEGHFGYVDGMSQPSVVPLVPTPKVYPNLVPLGDLLLGHRNGLGDEPTPGRLWDDSTFLVVRKLRQDADAFNDLCTRLQKSSKLTLNQVKGLLMGRQPGGDNLVTPGTGNDFDYTAPNGDKCPLHAHVRRANPRATRPDLKVVPRIVRRGMSYGPPFAAAPRAERGLLFMAYNASIAEQFELVQAWLAGGNSSGPGSSSGVRDPFVGVRLAGDPGTYPIDPQTTWTLDPIRPLVRLDWGLYSFVPSMRALRELRDLADEAAALDQDPSLPQHAERRQRELAMLTQKGLAYLQELKRVETGAGVDAARTQWKTLLEDLGARSTGISQAVWTAVREVHRGVLKTPYGVLVGSAALVKQVLSERRYSATGYAARNSFGEIYLGMDDGARYRAEATPVNAAIQGVTEAEGFAVARQHMRASVAAQLRPGQEVAVEIKELVDAALAGMCRHWFGLPDGTELHAGGWYADATPKPTCPGHFHAPSRYMFQPHPGAEAERVGQAHGRDLKSAVAAVIGSPGVAAVQLSRLGGPVVAASPRDVSRITRTLIGVMMGMLPTVDGNFRSVLYEWTQDRALWDHQLAYNASTEPEYDRAVALLRTPLLRTMQLRPVPELVWRTATEDHVLAGVPVSAGERIVVGLVSASQEQLLKGEDDVSHVFGGDRAGAQYPLHACPGQAMAMGVLLGMLAGLMELATLRPALSPTALGLIAR